MNHISVYKKDIMDLRNRADAIWKDLKLQRKRFFKEALKDITGSSSEVFIKGEEELASWVEKADCYALNICNGISSSQIPLLLQMYEFYYYGHWNREPAGLGTAIKRLIAYIYKNQFSKGEENFSESRLHLIKAIQAVSLQETLAHAEMITTLTEVNFNLTRQWLYPSDEKTEYYMLELAEMNKDLGKSHRTLKDAINVWTKNPKALLLTIEDILQGASPTNQQLFKDNIFRHLIRKGSPAFWENLRAHIHLLVTLTHKLNAENLPIDSVVILPNYKTLNKQKMLGANVQIKSNIYWKKKWYFDNINVLELTKIQNMLNYRPILGYTNDENLNVSTFSLVGDAINYFIEASIIDYEGHGTPFKNSYQKIIATPFEKEVIKVFQENGFIVGSIPNPECENKNSCQWIVNKDQKEIAINIQNKNNDLFPGEVDILAYHPIQHLFVLGECKTFHYPHTKKEMKSLISRLTNKSEGSYQKKIKNKLDWLCNSKFNMNINEINPDINGHIDGRMFIFQPIIITDRKIIDMNNENLISIVDVDHLKNALKNFNTQNE